MKHISMLLAMLLLGVLPTRAQSNLSFDFSNEDLQGSESKELSNPYIQANGALTLTITAPENPASIQSYNSAVGSGTYLFLPAGNSFQLDFSNDYYRCTYMEITVHSGGLNLTASEGELSESYTSATHTWTGTNIDGVTFTVTEDMEILNLTLQLEYDGPLDLSGIPSQEDEESTFDFSQVDANLLTFFPEGFPIADSTLTAPAVAMSFVGSGSPVLVLEQTPTGPSGVARLSGSFGDYEMVLTASDAFNITQVRFVTTGDATIDGYVTPSVGTMSGDQWTGSSSLLSFSFTNTPPDILQVIVTTEAVAIPAAEPVPSYNEETHELTLVTSTAGATIYYTLDGSNPTMDSNIYTTPILLTENTTVKAIAAGTGFQPSSIVSFHNDDFTCGEVGFSYAYPYLTMTVEPTDANIYYTLDGSDPTASADATLYEGPFELLEDALVRAYAVRTNFNNGAVTSYNFLISEHTAATPQFSRLGDELIITTATPAATIYYTFDPDEVPSTQSPIYTTPLQLTGNVTVRAMAVAEGMAASPVAIWQVNDFKVNEVTFSYQNLRLTMSTATADAVIYYTTDGSDPTLAASPSIYTSPIELTADAVVSAYASRETWTNADVTEYVFVLSDHTVGTPQLVRSGDGVEISTTTAGAAIYYTLDGSIPDSTSPAYASTILLDGNVTVQAIALHTDYYPSAVAQLVVDWFLVQDVVFNYANQALSMTTTTAGATIYYTTDGSTPDINSNLYTAPIPLTADCTVQAIAVRENWQSSGISSYVFNVANMTAESPLFSRTGNSITMEAPTDGTTIYYTTDGSDPTADPANPSATYTAPIEVTENMVIRAMAAGGGYNDSPVAVYVVNWFKTAPVVFDFAGLQLTMSTTTENATIYYTTDGSLPTLTSTAYTVPVALTEDCDVRAVAYRTNWNASDVTLFQFSRSSYTAPTPLFNRNGDVLTLSTGNVHVGIHYTTNGDMPTEGSAAYTAPIVVDSNCVVRAIATGEGYFDSEVSSYYVSWFKVANVEFSYQHQLLMMTTPTTNATIYYTTDGTLPTPSSTPYTSPISLLTDCDVRAIAVREGWNNSGVALYQFSLSNVTAPTPHFSRNGDVLTITTGSTDVKIYYTLDGSEPDTLSSMVYTSAIQLTRNCLVRAMAAGAAYQVSPIASYTVDWFKVANVEFSYDQQWLSMSTPTAEAVIHYTTDGTTPTVNSATYTAPVQLTDDCDVQAIAVHEGWTPSEVSLYHFIASTGSVALPQFARNGNTVTITTVTEGAKIYYTLDGSTPSATHGVPYTVPVELSENGVLQAVAVLSNRQYSGIASYSVNWFFVDNIVFSFDGQWLTMTSNTENVVIHYSLSGGSNPVTNAIYTAPIEILESCVVEAYGTKDHFHDSNVSRYVLDLEDLRSATPQLQAVGSTVEMFCATAGAKIYYTLDGSTPNENSSLYTGPITLTQNCTVKAISVCEGFRHSGFGSLEWTNFRVENVSIEYVDGFLYLTTPTPNSTIYYTLDGSKPTRHSSSYATPFALNAVTTVSAFAYKDGFNPSDVTSEIIDPANVRCAVPTFTLSDRLLTINTLTDGATIRYTLDGTRPDGNSTLYTGPITLTENGTVWAEVTKVGYSPADGKFVVGCFHVELPSFTFTDGRVVISSLTPDALIYYTTDGSEPTLSSERYSEPLSLPGGTHVRAVGMRRNFNNSLVSDYEVGVTSCASVDVAYNGHTFSLTTTTPGASIYYTLDGSNPSTSTYHYTAPTDVNQLVTIRAIAVKDGSNPSSVTVYEIPSIFNDETATATVRTAGTLGKALEWKDGATLTSLTVLGNLNATDFSTMNRISGIRHLYLQSVAVEDGALPARAFAGSGMISVELPAFVSSVGESLFAGCPNLSAIVWRTQAELPSAALADFSNPNLLFFTSNASYAPAEVRNVVTGRRASRITLTDAAPNGNFFCVRQFYADRITYTHDYQQETGRGETVRGWETIALPFSVTRFIHETKGDITPFMADDSDKAHFWLYSIEATGPTAASELTANRPYLISMPNHDTYADRYILGGNVTFEGLNTNIPITAPVAVSYNDHDVLPCFVRVKKTADIFVLNRGEQHGNHLEGSIFLSDYRDASPFEVYYTHAGTTGEVQGIGITGEIITGINDTMLLRSAAESCAEGLYDLSGRRVGRAGRVAQKGIYILDGKKVIIK